MSDSIKTTQNFTAAGVGKDQFYGRDRALHTMQVIIGGDVAPNPVKVTLEASLDNGTTWATIGTWDTADGRVSGDSISVGDAPWDRTRPHVVTMTGGTNPTVKVITLSADE